MVQRGRAGPYRRTGSAPQLDDEIIESDGLELYIDGDAFELLEDKVLDADRDGEAIRFSLRD